MNMDKTNSADYVGCSDVGRTSMVSVNHWLWVVHRLRICLMRNLGSIWVTIEK